MFGEGRRLCEGKKSKENGKCEIAEEKKNRWIEIITVEKCCS